MDFLFLFCLDPVCFGRCNERNMANDSNGMVQYRKEYDSRAKLLIVQKHRHNLIRFGNMKMFNLCPKPMDRNVDNGGTEKSQNRSTNYFRAGHSRTHLFRLDYCVCHYFHAAYYESSNTCTSNHHHHQTNKPAEE